METLKQSKDISSKEKKQEEAIEALKDIEYPVQQVGDEAPNKADVKEAVKELNPDPNSLGSRG